MMNDKLTTESMARQLIANLERRHIGACYCATAAEAIEKIQEMIPDGSTVTWGGSMTIRDMGLTQALHNRGTLNVLDRDLITDQNEKLAVYLKAFSADVFLTSANAISEDGVIVNIDGNGNRVAAISWGPKKVIFVVGMNKVAPNVKAAVARARSVAAPINAQRFDIDTPCKADRQCHNCNSADSICCYVHLLRNCRNAGRHHVVLVGENLGY